MSCPVRAVASVAVALMPLLGSVSGPAESFVAPSFAGSGRTRIDVIDAGVRYTARQWLDLRKAVEVTMILRGTNVRFAVEF